MHDRTSYLLPAAFALAIHSALFFGFKPDRHASPVGADTTDGTIFADPTPFVDMATPPDDSDNDDITNSRPSKGDEIPEIVDLPNMTPTGVFVIPVDYHPQFTPSRPGVRIISPGSPLGDSHGTTSGHLAPIDASQLDAVPRARFQIQPNYPQNARSAGVTGRVTVEFVVDIHGNVSRASILDSSDTVFDEATLRAVRRWRFEPGRMHGHPTAFRMRVPIEFSLSGN